MRSSLGRSELARRRAEMPAGTRAILDRRTLATAHRRLAALLRPGLRVFDVGCGGGAITRGIAERVAPTGRAVGIDVNADFVADARRRHAGVAGLTFEVGDVTRLAVEAEFDIVTAARVLQWLANPLVALQAMVRAVRPGGRVVVLDYNHERAAWTPEPPASMRVFYAAFLRWRVEAGFDSAIADRLPGLMETAGLQDIVVTPQHEVVQRGDADFEMAAGIWADVAATRGRQMVADGVISEAARAAAEAEYRTWVRTAAETHTHYLLAVEGIRP